MDRRTLLAGLGASAIASALTGLELQAQSGSVSGSEPVYELRIYHAMEGKLPELEARFRDHTMTIFERHGMKNIGYWTPTDDPLKGKTLIYIIEHASREQATANWKAFSADPEWKQVQTTTEANGKLVDHVDSTFMVRTPYSPKI
jgi:NIPSNAP